MMKKIKHCPSAEGKTCWGLWSGECKMKPENTNHNMCGFCWAYANLQWKIFEKEFNENKLSPYGEIN